MIIRYWRIYVSCHSSHSNRIYLCLEFFLITDCFLLTDGPYFVQYFSNSYPSLSIAVELFTFWTFRLNLLSNSADDLLSIIIYINHVLALFSHILSASNINSQCADKRSFPYRAAGISNYLLFRNLRILLQ